MGVMTAVKRHALVKVTKLRHAEFSVIMVQSTAFSVHPSIFYTHLIRRSGRGGDGAYSSGHRARGGVHPGQVISPSQGAFSVTMEK